MKNFFTLLLCAMLVACASAPMQQASENRQHVFNDALFAPSYSRINADDVFAFSPEMQRYLDNEIARKIQTEGKIMALVDNFYRKDQLKFAFDATKTHNAAETFEARSGNCLSITIMTAAFAKHMGIPVQFHNVSYGEVWDRNNNIEFLIGHVNLTLGTGLLTTHEPARLVDFGAFEDARGEILDDIGEDVIVAMYMNNRAGESLAKGDLDDAYWWARAAILHTPQFLSSYNTLGVIYSRHHNLPQAEYVFSRVLEHEPDNVLALNNQVQVLKELGRTQESAVLASRLAAIQPNPPYYFFNRGLQAMKAGDYYTAKDLFTKEVNRASYNHQFHFWLALANYYIGDMYETRKQLSIAMENSPNTAQHDLYAAKLRSLKMDASPH